jgi:2-hydroxychromene-2-carboxylate isomerase
MSGKVIEYFYSVSSPWAYMGTPHLIEIAQRHGATIDLRNIVVVPENGGIPLLSRPRARQNYHAVELDRWRKRLNMPLKLKPKFYPTDPRPAAHMVIAAKLRNQEALRLSFAFQRALWAEDRDIQDPAERCRIADENGFDGAALLKAAEAPEAKATWERNRTDAIARGIFGTPTYCYGSELFWGQDRLEFLDAAMAAA